MRIRPRRSDYPCSSDSYSSGELLHLRLELSLIEVLSLGCGVRKKHPLVLGDLLELALGHGLGGTLLRGRFGPGGHRRKKQEGCEDGEDLAGMEGKGRTVDTGTNLAFKKSARCGTA